MTKTIGPESNVLVSIATLQEAWLDESFLRRLLSSTQNFVSGDSPMWFQTLYVDHHDEFHEGTMTPLDNGTFPQLMHALGSHDFGEVRLVKGDPPEVSFVLPTRFRGSVRHRWLHLESHRERLSTAEGREVFLRVANMLFQSVDGVFGDLWTAVLMPTGPHPEIPDEYILVPTNLEHGLPPPKWGFLLGHDYVKLLGVERLKSAPCEVVREFDEIGFLLLLAEDLEVLEKDNSLLEARRRQLVDHLGREFFSYIDVLSPKKVLPQFGPGR
jgi:hypothetical protein